jgi:hypothetical protein
MQDVTEEIPLFPLPGLMYYPGRLLPLYVFEDRYRELMRDALAGDRRFAMAVFRPGWEPNYDERPPVFPIVCIGKITKHKVLPDGRFVLHLKGERRAIVVGEKQGKLYRVAIVKTLQEEPIQNGKQEELLTQLERKIIELSGRPILPPYDPALSAPPELSAIDIADEATLGLPFPIERKLEISAICNHEARIRELLRSMDEMIELKKKLRRADGVDPENLMMN